MTASPLTPAAAPGTDGAGDPGPSARIAAALRRAITAGTIAPGTRLCPAEIAARHHASANASLTAFSALRGELVIWHRHRWYAAPAGPPDPATGARLGAALTRLRTTAGQTPEQFADAIPTRPGIYFGLDDVLAAETGHWQPRDFWQGCDTALGADGTLLRLHDTWYVGPGGRPGPQEDDAEECYPPPAAPGLHPAIARVAAEIAARVAAGHWPPGTRLPAQRTLAGEHSTNPSFIYQAMRELAGQGILTRTSYGYFTPGPVPHPVAASRTVIAVVLEWDDGTRTRLACTPAHQPAMPPPALPGPGPGL